MLDTNIVSEAWRSTPSAHVVDWIDAQSSTTLFICAPVLAELYFGAERLPLGRRKDILVGRIERAKTVGFRDRVLPFDQDAAVVFGRLAARREVLGRPLGQVDGMIAAIASVHNMVVATRDIGDFADLDIEVVNPFEISAIR